MIRLIQSLFEKGIFEVFEGERLVKEIRISFLRPKMRIPSDFFSLADLEKWVAETELKMAKQKVYWLLGRRSYSSFQLLRKLKEEGYQEEISEQVIEEAKRLGYVQDEEFLDRLIEREFQKGYGPRFIEQKLKSQGLSSSAVRQKISPERQKEAIQKCLQKKIKGDRTKKIRSLQQRGFDFEIILQMIENFSS